MVSGRPSGPRIWEVVEEVEGSEEAAELEGAVWVDVDASAGVGVESGVVSEASKSIFDSSERCSGEGTFAIASVTDSLCCRDDCAAVLGSCSSLKYSPISLIASSIG